MTKPQTMDHLAFSHDAMCTELLSVMREQERVCEQLLDISGAERKLVLDGRIVDLEKATREKSELIGQMDGLELRRRELSTQMAARLGLSNDAPLTALAARMGSQGAKDLLELRRRVTDLAARLKDSNETNVMLMRKSLAIVKDSLQQLRRSMGGGESYTNSGRPAMTLKNNVMVDCRA